MAVFSGRNILVKVLQRIRRNERKESQRMAETPFPGFPPFQPRASGNTSHPGNWLQRGLWFRGSGTGSKTLSV